MAGGSAGMGVPGDLLVGVDPWRQPRSYICVGLSLTRGALPDQSLGLWGSVGAAYPSLEEPGLSQGQAMSSSTRSCTPLGGVKTASKWATAGR
jgi:hypothetical protein